MDPKDFHAVALTLVGADNTSAECRTAVSRSYYAVYHVAFQLLESLGLAPRTDKWAHDDIRDHLANAGSTTLDRLSTSIGDLHGKRIDADYDLDDPEIETNRIAQRIVHRAARLMDELDRVKQDPDKEQLVASMKEWVSKRQQQGKKTACPACGYTWGMRA